MSELSVGQLRGLTVNDNVITMPSGHSLYAPGHVVQVVSVNNSTTATNSSNTYVTTGLSATITPSSTSSKVVVFVSTNGRTVNNNSVGTWTIFRGTVDGTDLAPGAHGITSLYSVAAGELVAKVSGHLIDSPNTTSAQTYTFAFKNTIAGGGTISSQHNSSLGNITLMEIAQ
jgi:hypothetical protein